MNEEVGEIKGFVRGLLWGILLVVGALIFLETEKGQKIKKKLKIKGGNLIDELPDFVEKLEEKGRELIEEAIEVEKEIKEQTDVAGQKLTEKTEVAVEQSLGHIEALQEHGREITTGIKRRLFKNIPKKKRATLPN